MMYLIIFLIILTVTNGSHMRWENPISYTINNNITSKDNIIQVIKYYEQITNVKFVERTNQEDYIEFADMGACFSKVGKQGGLQYISITTGCDVGAIIHEIGHAIGLIHEQSKYDRDNYIEIKYENIENDKRKNFLQTVHKEESIYDFNSIMHYGQWDFSKNGEKTIDVKVDTNACFIGQAYKLSYNDVISINNLIGEPGEPKNIDNSQSIYVCGGRTFESYSLIYTEYINNGNNYKSKWQIQGAFSFIEFNSNSKTWEIIYKNQVYAKSITNNLNTTKWMIKNKQTKNLELDESSYIGHLTEDNSIHISSSNYVNYKFYLIVILVINIF